MNDKNLSDTQKRLITRQNALLLLKPLFTSLPAPKDTDHEALFDVYMIALDGMSLQALQNVVLRIIKGDAGYEMKFCPRPPELASLVRREDAAIDIMRAPKPDHRPDYNGPMVSIMQKRWEGKRALATGVDLAKFKPKDWPVGSMYVPILSTVFAPGQADKAEKSAEQLKIAATYAAYREWFDEGSKRTEDTGPMTAEKAEYWRKIQALNDRPEQTKETYAFRDNIKKQVEEFKEQESEF